MDKSKSPEPTSPRPAPSELKLLARQWGLHARLFVSAALGIAVTLALLALPLRMSTRLLSGWDIGVALYLVLSYRAAARAAVATIRQRAAINDEGAVALLVLVTAAALASLAAVIAELGHTPGVYQLVLGVSTIVLSWTFMHWIFALHYAREFYGSGRNRQVGGLLFPGKDDPDYWDFFY